MIVGLLGPFRRFLRWWEMIMRVRWLRWCRGQGWRVRCRGRLRR